MSGTAAEPGVRSVMLSPDLAGIAQARRFVADVATEAGFAEARVFDITLVCSEAAANAIEHAPFKGRSGGQDPSLPG